MDTLRDRLGTWFKPYAALVLTILVGGVVIVSLALLGAEVYDNVVDSAGLANLDKPALALSESLRSPGLDAFVTGFTNIGGGIGMPILASILVAYLFLLHLNSLLWRIVSMALAVGWFVTIGLTRAFLGYHWLTDVMAGWLLGLAWTAMVITCHRLYLTVQRVQSRTAPPAAT